MTVARASHCLPQRSRHATGPRNQPGRRVAPLWQAIRTLPEALSPVPAAAVMPPWRAVSSPCTSGWAARFAPGAGLRLVSVCQPEVSCAVRWRLSYPRAAATLGSWCQLAAGDLAADLSAQKEREEVCLFLSLCLRSRHTHLISAGKSESRCRLQSSQPREQGRWLCWTMLKGRAPLLIARQGWCEAHRLAGKLRKPLAPGRHCRCSRRGTLAML